MHSSSKPGKVLILLRWGGLRPVALACSRRNPLRRPPRCLRPRSPDVGCGCLNEDLVPAVLSLPLQDERHRLSYLSSGPLESSPSFPRLPTALRFVSSGVGERKQDRRRGILPSGRQVHHCREVSGRMCIGRRGPWYLPKESPCRPSLDGRATCTDLSNGPEQSIESLKPRIARWSAHACEAGRGPLFPRQHEPRDRCTSTLVRPPSVRDNRHSCMRVPDLERRHQVFRPGIGVLTSAVASGLGRQMLLKRIILKVIIGVKHQ